MITKIDTERLFECYSCDYFETCIKTIEEPEDFPDGSCKTKSLIFEKGYNAHDKSLICRKS